MLIAFAFALHLSFSGQRHQIWKKNQREKKEKRSLDPGHCWPDPDAGHGSGPLWPGFWFRIRTRIRIYGSRSRCGLNARTFRTFYGPSGLSGLCFIPQGYAAVCVWRWGESAFNQNLGQKKKNCPSGPITFLDCAQVFYTRRGGIGGPNPPYGALGSPGKYSHNLFYQN